MLVKIGELSFEEHGLILCYPRPSPSEFEGRLGELQRLGVEALEFTGGKSLGKLQVLGKGNSALVLVAWAGGRRFALKVRRVDSGKPDVSHEAELTRAANGVGVGPRLHASTENMLLMELVEGLNLPAWLGLPDGRPPDGKTVRSFLLKVLQQCRRLDLAGIDHGELSRASKHVMVKSGGEPCILDFEKASLKRRPSNVTSLSQYLLLRGSPITLRIAEALGGLPDKEKILERLRGYKAEPTSENFGKILNLLGLN
ncbi:MAG: serine/threonine protein kinase [Candidatus Hecatellales archaeon]|nr:MAG: serine/threonine protein kinase [Candidatus Hecatellales archaeon]